MQLSSSHDASTHHPSTSSSSSVAKRFRSGSISSRLRSASELFDEGVIETRHQKGILKDLIISEDVRLIEAFNQYERGDKKAVERLIHSFNLDFRKSSLDLLGDVGDLSMDFLSVGGTTAMSNGAGSHGSSSTGAPLFLMDEDSVEFFETDAFNRTPPFHPSSLTAIAAATRRDGTGGGGGHHHHHHHNTNKQTKASGIGGGGRGVPQPVTAAAAATAPFGIVPGRKREPSLLLDVGTPLPSSVSFGAHLGPKMSFSGDADFFELLPGSRNAPMTPHDDFSPPSDPVLRGGMFGQLRTLLDPTMEDDRELAALEESIIFKLGNGKKDGINSSHATAAGAAATTGGAGTSKHSITTSKPTSTPKSTKSHRASSSHLNSRHPSTPHASAASSSTAAASERTTTSSSMATRGEKSSGYRTRGSPVPSGATPSAAITIPGQSALESLEERTAQRRAQGISLVGAYSPESRRMRVLRFVEKRDRRVWKKKVKYDVRKNFADSRLRVKGRFVKKEDEETLRDLMTLT